MSGIIKSSAKILAIAGLAIGFSAMGFAKSGSTSIINNLNNTKAADNTAATVNAAKQGSTGSSNNGGNSHGTNHGGHNPPPNCVPEPMSMLALGIGSGVVFLKKRAKKA